MVARNRDNRDTVLEDFEDEVIDIIGEVVKIPLTPITLEGYADEDIFMPMKFSGEVDSEDEDDALRLSLDVLSVIVSEEEAERIVGELQPRLAPLGFQVVITGRGHADFCQIFRIGLNQTSENYEGKALVVFFRSRSIAPLFWVRQTNGANFEVSTADIIKTLESWISRCSYYVLGAGFDWVEIVFNRLPTDLEDFAQELYEFCPDVLEQGIAKEIPPNLSEAEMMKFMEEALDTQDAHDLAEYLKREKKILLWWD